MIGFKLLRKIKYGPMRPLAPLLSNIANALVYDDDLRVIARQPKGYHVIRQDFIDAVLVDGFQYKWRPGAIL